MKRFLKYYIAIIIFVCLASITYADIVDYNAGNRINFETFGKGSWNDWFVGIKVGVVDSDGRLKDVEIFLNSEGKTGVTSYMGCKFSSSNKPKIYQDAQIKWISCDDVDTYNVDFLPSTWNKSNNNINKILKDDNYKNLKSILEHESLNDSLAPGDYIIVEPMAKIGVYYGTAYELANSGFLGESNNKIGNTYWGSLFGGADYGYSCTKGGKLVDGKCTKGEKVRNDKRSGGIFKNTIYLTESVLGMNAYTPKACTTTSNCKTMNEDFKKQSHGAGIGVYKYDDIYISGLIISKYKKGTNSLIISDSAEFEIYYGKDCKDVLYLWDINGSDWFGKVTWLRMSNDMWVGFNNPIKVSTYGGRAIISDLPSGYYSIKETKVPRGYKELDEDEKCVVPSVYVESNKTTRVNIENTGSCNEVLDSLVQQYGSKQNIPDEILVDLYQNEYPNNNNLLNFDNPTCDAKACPRTSKIEITGCLSAEGYIKDADENDFSCSEQYYSGNGSAYCNDTYELDDNLGFNGIGTFYAKSGRFFLRKDTDGTLLQTKKGLDGKYYVEDRNNDILTTGTINRNCMVYGSPDDSFGATPPDINISLNDKQLDVDLNRTYYNREKLVWYTYTYCVSCCGGGDDCTRKTRTITYYKYEYDYTWKYDYRLNDLLNTIYIENLTGKIVKEDEKSSIKTYTKHVGLISRLNGYLNNQKNNIIPFTLTYGEQEPSNMNSQNWCQYETKKEIVETPQGGEEPTELNIEFRSIDTTTPFGSDLNNTDRNTNTNWCDGDNCSFDNNIVRQYINNSVNSYGLDSNGIRHNYEYKIVLTPDDIKEIRKYNKTHRYDEYELISVTGKTKKYNSFTYNLIMNSKINGVSLLRQIDNTTKENFEKQVMKEE